MDKEEVEFLWNASRCVPVNSVCSGLIASHLLSKCVKHAGYGTVTLPRSVFKSSVSCQFCCSVWRQRPHQLAIKPQKALTKSLRKSLRRYQKSGVVREVEKGFIKRFEQSQNTLEFTCPVCSKKSKFPLTKEGKKPPVSESSEVPPEAEERSKGKKKRKRNKDRLCGLKVSLCSPDLRVPPRDPPQVVSEPQTNVPPASQVSVSPDTPSSLKPPPGPASDPMMGVSVPQTTLSRVSSAPQVSTPLTQSLKRAAKSKKVEPSNNPKNNVTAQNNKKNMKKLVIGVSKPKAKLNTNILKQMLDKKGGKQGGLRDFLQSLS